MDEPRSEEPSRSARRRAATAGVQFGRELPWLAGLSGVVAAVYSPIVFATYGFADDYALLVFGTRDNVTIPKIGLADGRPVQGLFEQVAFSLAGDVSGLRWVRVVGIIGTALAAAMVYLVCRECRFSPLTSCVAAIVVACMPSFQVLTSWAVVAVVPYGVALGLGAGLLVARMVHGSRGPPVRVAVLSTLLLVLALAVYQPAAMCFWPVVVVVTVARLPDDTPSWRGLLAAAAIFSAALVVYYASFRALAAAVGVAPSPRTGLTPISGVRGKLSWFLRDPLPRAVNPFELHPHARAAVIIGAIMVVGVLIRLRTVRMPWRLSALIALAVAIPVSYAPVLGTIANWPAARSRVALELLLVQVAALAAQGYGSLLPHRWVRPAAVCMGAVAVAVMATFAAWRVTAYFTRPQEIEYALARHAIEVAPIDPARSLYTVRARWRETLAPARALDEFGLASTYQPWVPAPLVKLVLRQADRAQPARVVVLASGTHHKFSQGDVVIDFGALLERAKAPSDDR